MCMVIEFDNYNVRHSYVGILENFKVIQLKKNRTILSNCMLSRTVNKFSVYNSICIKRLVVNPKSWNLLF